MFNQLRAATLFLVMLFLANPSFAEDAKMNRTLSMSGHGETRQAPDLATITLGVFSTAKTARQALDANTAEMTQLMAVIKGAGIEAKDVTTSNFSINPRYQDNQTPGQPPKIVGYDVSNTVFVVERKIDGLGKLLDAAVSSGSNQINGISFGIDDPGAATDKAREAAVADALRKAQLIAKAAGVSLGNIVSIGESGGAQPPVPVYAKAAMRAEAADVPIAQGEQTVSADVNVVWEIK
jgi:uncharacterized protein